MSFFKYKQRFGEWSIWPDWLSMKNSMAMTQSLERKRETKDQVVNGSIIKKFKFHFRTSAFFPSIPSTSVANAHRSVASQSFSVPKADPRRNRFPSAEYQAQLFDRLQLDPGSVNPFGLNPFHHNGLTPPLPPRDRTSKSTHSIPTSVAMSGNNHHVGSRPKLALLPRSLNGRTPGVTQNEQPLSLMPQQTPPDTPSLSPESSSNETTSTSVITVRHLDEDPDDVRWYSFRFIRHSN